MTTADNIRIFIFMESKTGNRPSLGWIDQWSDNVTFDPAAPSLFSEQVIWFFSFLFGTIAGAALLAVNISRAKEKVGIIWVLLFGFIYFIGSVLGYKAIIAYFVIQSVGPIFFFNTVGGVILNKFFWKKYIGAETKYRAKPFWIPLAICAFLVGMALIGRYVTDNIYNQFQDKARELNQSQNNIDAAIDSVRR